MTEERFQALADRFERLSRRAPRAYRALVVGLAACGYAYVAFWLVLSLGLLALLVLGTLRAPGLLKLALPVGFFCWVLVRALHVRLQRPEGIALTADRAPALFAEIARLRRLGRVPRLHRVLVDDRLNASVSQVPRLGLLGWPHNDLVVGLPLLLALSPDAFRAVLAHELGHLSGQHGRLGAWIFRVRVTWIQVVGALAEKRSRMVGLFRGFFRWYGPYFGAATFALAREQEREADRFAASAAGARASADALVGVALADALLDDRFWPGLQRRACAEPEPPDGHLALLGGELAVGLDPAAAEEALRRLLLPRSRGQDTHPSTAERLAALGEAPRVPPPPRRSAAEHFLGPALADVRAALEARWRDSAREPWAREHEQGRARERRLAELEARSAGGPLGAAEASERAALVERQRGRAAALPLAAAVVAEHPDHAPARFALGRMLLADGRDDGLAHVERAIALDAEAELPGAQLIARHHLALGRADAARPWIARAERLEAWNEAAQAERAEVRVGDPLEPHRLSPADAAALVAPVRGHPRVRQLLLARKRLVHAPEQAPVLVLGVVPRAPWYRLTRRRDDRELAQAIADALPGPWRVFVFVRNDGTRALFRRLRRLDGAAVG